MTAFIAWGGATLAASALLMLLVLAVRAPMRRWIGPQLGYALWALPAVRLVLPSLPAGVFDALPLAGRAAAVLPVLFIGPRGASGAGQGTDLFSVTGLLFAIWLVGTIALFTLYSVRHYSFCRRLRRAGIECGSVGKTRIIAVDGEGPLAFGITRRFVAVPHTFRQDYNASERHLALAHECAHHARGDLIANWASLMVLAIHWWNPVAWAAIRAFREDQEYAADAHVLAAREPDAIQIYAQVLAKAAGIGALPACNLNLRSNLKGRLMMIRQNRRSRGRLVSGSAVLMLLGGAALAATATIAGASGAATGKQAVTIGVKPDGAGGYALIIGNTLVASGTPLPGGMTLPADFDATGGCNLKASARPFAMVIKGVGGTRTYTVMCGSAAPAPLRATLAEGLASLNTMRASVTAQPASAVFPEAERAHALGAIDVSVREVEATLAALS